MEYKNVIHPEEEYRALGKILIDAMPELDDALEDQDIIDMYNEIKDRDPNVSLDQLQSMVPSIVAKIKEQAMSSGDATGNLNALQSIGV